ncbi:recombinase family protein [Pseudoroseomonas wenyumeiae]
MRIAIYGRVSTSHQVEHQTIEQQLGRLVAHIGTHAAEAWALDPAHVFRDDGFSGAVLARPGLDRLRDAVKVMRWTECSSRLPTALRATTSTRWCSWRSGGVPGVPRSSWTGP